MAISYKRSEIFQNIIPKTDNIIHQNLASMIKLLNSTFVLKVSKKFLNSITSFFNNFSLFFDHMVLLLNLQRFSMPNSVSLSLLYFINLVILILLVFRETTFHFVVVILR